MNTFSSLHPAVLFIYFLSVTFLTMFVMNPILLVISLAGAMAYSLAIRGGEKFIGELGFSIPLFLLIALTNPIFSHNGETILFFLNDQRVTLEAIIYGIFIAMMLISVMRWFSSCSEIMTSDKVICLTGHIFPKLSITLSMAMRFVPLFKRKFIEISEAQKVMGLYATQSIADRITGLARVFSALVGQSLENAVLTADSMKARGYGLPGRTSFSLFAMKRKDNLLLATVIFLTAALTVGIYYGALDFSYYPVITDIPNGFKSIVAYLLFAVLSFLPVMNFRIINAD